MKPISKTSHINTTLQVLQQMNDGMNVVETSRAVGIPRSTFYYIAKNNPEAIAEYRDIIVANTRE